MVTRNECKPADGPTVRQTPQYAREQSHTSQRNRRAARAFVAAVAAGRVPGAWPGIRIVASEEHGAQLEYARGSYPVRGWLGTSLILSWWDSVLTAEDVGQMTAAGVDPEQIDRREALAIADWVIADAWITKHVASLSRLPESAK